MLPIITSAFRRSAPAALAVLFLALSTAQSFARDPVVVTGQAAGPTVFISLVSLTIDNPNSLEFYSFSIQPKTGSHTRPVSARYSGDYLKQRGFLNSDTTSATVPVFGLYANYNNTVTMTFRFLSGSTQVVTVPIQTGAFDVTPAGGPNPYTNKTVVQARSADTTLSYDFFLLKSTLDGTYPILMDTDGEVRWSGLAPVPGNLPSILYKNGIYITQGTSVIRFELDGEITFAQDFSARDVLDFYHNIDTGRDGMILEPDTPEQNESVYIEIDMDGNILRRWDFSQIISDAMTAGGDDPSGFVSTTFGDWFHSNAATYRASDNTLIASSRENFVIAVDYDTQEIKWILGDTTKQWAQYPSLRKYALGLGANTQPPVGQHAVSIDRDRLLLLDDGHNSEHHTPAGKNRAYSTPRRYKLDLTARTATEVQRTRLLAKNIYAPYCSSIYADLPNNYLVDYSCGGQLTFTELQGFDATGAKVFDYQFPAVHVCGTGWNAIPIHLEDMVFN